MNMHHIIRHGDISFIFASNINKTMKDENKKKNTTFTSDM